MTIVTWTPDRVRPILKSWCAGASGGQIAKQTLNERGAVNYILDRVTLANNLSVRSDLRAYSPATLLKRFEIYRQEAANRATKGGASPYEGEPLGMSPGQLREANQAFLSLLELHHGESERAFD